MTKLACAILVALALGAASVQAQSKLADVLKQNKITLFPAVVDIAGATKAVSDPKAIWTALVPSDAAVQAFLKDMGLTVDDLKARPGLAKKLLGSHIILAGNVRAEELFAGGRTSRVVEPLGGRINDLTFTRAADGKVTVTGAQGVTANVDAKHIPVDEFKTIHIIDKVLFGEGYYPSFAALCKERDTVKDFCGAVATAGLGSTVNSKDFAHTVLVPNNAAFTGVGLNSAKAPAPAAVADILKYHVLAGAPRELAEIKPGSVQTLAGQPLTLKHSKGSVGGKSVLETTFTSNAGTTANVLRSNIFVGKSIVNGIDKVLVPKADVKAVAAPAPAKAAAAPAKAAAAPAKAAGRRLLGFGWGGEAGSTYVEDATQNAIYQAVNGVGSAAAAANTGLSLGEAYSEPGMLNSVANGGGDW